VRVQVEECVQQVLIAARPKRSEIVRAVQGLRSLHLEAEGKAVEAQGKAVEAWRKAMDALRRAEDAMDRLVEAERRAWQEARRADGLRQELLDAHMECLRLQQTVNAHVALGEPPALPVWFACSSLIELLTPSGPHAEQIQQKVLGKPGARMSAEEWQRYVDADEGLKELMVSRAPKWAETLGEEIVRACRVADKRAFGAMGYTILFFTDWYTEEQIWVLGCILTRELYRWTAEPWLEGYSFMEQRRVMKDK
jgi:hypothetical protein